MVLHVPHIGEAWGEIDEQLVADVDNRLPLLQVAPDVEVLRDHSDAAARGSVQNFLAQDRGVLQHGRVRDDRELVQEADARDDGWRGMKHEKSDEKKDGELDHGSHPDSARLTSTARGARTLRSHRWRLARADVLFQQPASAILHIGLLEQLD